MGSHNLGQAMSILSVDSSAEWEAGSAAKVAVQAGRASQSELRRQLWEVEGCTVKVPMELCKVWDGAAGRRREGVGGVWPIEASCVLVDGVERWVLDELPTELSEHMGHPKECRPVLRLQSQTSPPAASHKSSVA